MARWFCQLVLFGCLILCLGCSDGRRSDRITTGYGRKAGMEYVNSVNGTAIFAEMTRASGDSVSRAELITPRIERFDRIVWVRDRYEVPSQVVIDALEGWLANGYNRQLVIVGRDYDAAIDYWGGVVQSAQGNDLIEARRRLAMAKSAFQRRRTSWDKTADSCNWFDIEDNDYRPAVGVSGDWSQLIDSSKADLKVGMVLNHGKPDPTVPWDKRYEAEVLLSVDSQPMVTLLTKNNLRSAEIYVISNASFLTNFGLANRENQILAQELIDTKSFDRATLFLETSPDGATVSSVEAGQETWAWITKPPLKYIVPHFLMLGIFFCFVFFPIFGRAKRSDPDEDHATFRDHIRAMGKLMSISKDDEYAKEKVDKYTSRHWNEH